MTTLPILYVSFEELCQSISINEKQMLELIEQDIVTPVTGRIREEWKFNVTAISIANKAARIHLELLVDWADIPLVLNLLEEIDELRAENDRLKQRMSRFLVDEC